MMAIKRNHAEQLDAAMKELANSVLELSDDEIVREIRESGIDPQEEAERTRGTLLFTLQRAEALHKRLWEMGHTINPNSWKRGDWGYDNKCANCGMAVSLANTGNEMRGTALDEQCHASDRFTFRKREASGR
jgi:hypothetical protein